MKISIMGKIDDKSRFLSTFISENLDFNQYLRDNRIVTKFSPNIGFGQKFPENVDLGQNLEICRPRSKFIKISKLVKILKKYRFWSKLSEILDFYQNVDLGQNCI